jgi:hypothetical protein
MFMQAWGNYGTAWSVIHQQLGVRPFLNLGTLQVVPQVPPNQPSVAGSNIRLGSGSVDVSASRAGSVYTTRVDATRTPVTTLIVGHTLPTGARIASVQLDGTSRRDYTTTQTNRGLEVTIPAQPGAAHTLTVTTK